MLTVGSLFSGIGGFDLGFERAGCRTLWMVEQDPFCQWVLHKHWPDTPIHPDITRFYPPHTDEVDVLCGGFPCQDVSVLTNTATGVDGSRSGLWSHFARLIRDLRPRYVVAENSPQLATRGLDRVLCDLAALGYDAEWHCLPASALGALHIRSRVWIVAYASGNGLEGSRRSTRLLEKVSWERWRENSRASGRWTVERELPRVANGFPGRLDPDWPYRVRATGNTLIPQIAEWIAQCIMREDSLSRGISRSLQREEAANT